MIDLHKIAETLQADFRGQLSLEIKDGAIEVSLDNGRRFGVKQDLQDYRDWSSFAIEFLRHCVLYGRSPDLPAWKQLLMK